ncbi:MAG: element excision factor XisH family protein [Cyanobacteria bacterium P01_E01_bin.42]
MRRHNGSKGYYQDEVKHALEKQQWCITADPLLFKFGGVKFLIDLAAEGVLRVDRGDEKIAVEIKSFLNPSTVTDFYAALGQFLSYRVALEATEPERVLYLAIPLDTYQTFFQLEFTRTTVRSYQVKLIVYDDAREEIVQWIS